MKYVFAGLAVVAAVAALFFRPPLATSPPGLPAEGGAAARAIPRVGLRATRRPGAVPDRTAPRIVVYVAGEVMRPGVYAFAPGTRAQDALARAGGPKPDADLVAVNLAALVDDGAEIAFPKIGEAIPRSRRASSARPHAGRTGRTGRGHGRHARPARPEITPQDVDLNAADEAELETLPGIGPALAARIVAYRETNGPFASVDELADVSGITPRLQDELANLVVIR